MSQADRITVEVARPAPDLELLSARRVNGVLPKHLHEEYQLALVEAGQLVYHWRGGEHRLEAGAALLVGPNEVHAARARGCTFRIAHVGLGRMTEVSRALGTRRRAVQLRMGVQNDRKLARLLGRLHSGNGRSVLESDELVVRTLGQIVGGWGDAEVLPPDGASELRAVRLAREYLHANFARAVTLDELARIAGLSKYHFLRRFERTLGLPPHAYQTQLRIARVCALLRDGVPTFEAASQVGFADESHLIRHFKRVNSVTPGQYARRQYAMQPRASGWTRGAPT